MLHHHFSHMTLQCPRETKTSIMVPFVDEKMETSNHLLKSPWSAMEVRIKAIFTHYKIIRVIYLIIKQFAILSEPNIEVDMGVRRESDSAQQNTQVWTLMWRTTIYAKYKYMINYIYLVITLSEICRLPTIFQVHC